MCPKEAFNEASNGLNFFLSQFPHMDEDQKTKIEDIICLYSQPFDKKKMYRQALQCSVGSDGTLHISPIFKNSSNPEE